MTGLICVWQPEPRETHPAVPARVRGDTPSACSCGAGCRQGQHGALAENDEVDERPVIVNLAAQHAGDAAPVGLEVCLLDRMANDGEQGLLGNLELAAEVTRGGTDEDPGRVHDRMRMVVVTYIQVCPRQYRLARSAGCDDGCDSPVICSAGKPAFLRLFTSYVHRPS